MNSNNSNNPNNSSGDHRMKRMPKTRGRDGGYASPMKLVLWTFVVATIFSPNLRSIRRLSAFVYHSKDFPSDDSPTIAKTSGGRVQEVDCQILPPADHDPNRDMEEDPKRLVDLMRDDDMSVVPTPEFWIALHRREFDKIRWDSIMRHGLYYESGVTRIFQEILQPSEPKGLVLDVGMNIGWFTLLSRAMGHQVMGFDPNPIMHRRVCSSLAYNHWWDRDVADSTITSSDSSSVSTFLYGLGDQFGTLKFEVGRNPGGGSLVEGRHEKTEESKKMQWDVPITTLDRIASERGWLSEGSTAAPIIHLLKIDVEGYEPFVIRGASKLIRSGLIRNILHENTHFATTTEEALESIHTMFQGLVEAGYKIHAVTNTGGVIKKVYQTIVGPTNLRLRNGTFAGSEMHQHLAKTHTNVWWKKLEDTAGDAKEPHHQQHTLEASIAMWKELEKNHTLLYPNGTFHATHQPPQGRQKNRRRRKNTKKAKAR